MYKYSVSIKHIEIGSIFTIVKDIYIYSYRESDWEKIWKENKKYYYVAMNNTESNEIIPLMYIFKKHAKQYTTH